MCMSWDDAQRFVMPLGKHKGKQIYEIAETDKGLRYLDWLIGQPWVLGRLKTALESYLKDPVIAKEVEAALEESSAWEDERHREDD